MKKLLYILPAIALCFTAQSCKDDDFSKHSIDAQYETGTTTVAGTPAAAPLVVDYQSATIAGNLSSIADVVEQGIQISTSEDFSDAKYYANTGDLATDYNVTISGLEGSTTYYARSYAITTAGGYVFGEAQTFTTPRTPIYTVDGLYTMVDYALNEDNGAWELDGDPYELSISFVDGSDEDIIISNLYGMGADIKAVYDAETGEIEVPSFQIVGNHPSYGNMFFRGLAPDMSAYSDVFTFQFTSLGGTLVSTSPYALCVAAGYFGFFMSEGTHQEIAE
ncbi:MAG: hypothetical protein J5486_01015 [Bacteroidaceae bacterium]|nr:hypothetical protein [Bacteroidaceae bacterium]